MDRSDLLVVMGLPESEVAGVDETPAGTIVATTDGNRYIHVPDDAPDADGKTGVMFLAAPTANYQGTFPVFTQEGATDTDPEAGEDETDGAAQIHELQEVPGADAEPSAAQKAKGSRAKKGSGS